MAADGPAPYIPLLGSADRAKSTRAASLALGGIALGALLLFAAGSELLPFPAQLLQLPLKSFEASATVAARPPDAVTSLPGAPPLDTVQYAGLVTVNSTARNKLFYWFAESSRVKDDLEEKSKVPIVIWLNGGCGSAPVVSPRPPLPAPPPRCLASRVQAGRLLHDGLVD